MIRGKKRKAPTPITVEDVLSRIDEYSIFRYYLGVDFKIGKSFCNPYRNDRNPSCSISRINGGLQFMDWSQAYWRGDCFDILQKRYNCDLQAALQMVNQDFGLGLGSGDKFHIRKAPVYKVPKVEEKTHIIQFTGNQKFSRSYESRYWNDYHFSFDILRREGTYCVRTLYIDREKFTLPKDEPVFAYYEEDIKAVKIYRPFANKERKEWKWKSTIPFKYIHGLSKMQLCDKIVTFKSNKDRFCGLHFLDQALAVQGESLAAISEQSLTRMRELSSEQYLCFGTDPQGKRESHIITAQLGLKHVNMPDRYMPANDPAEVAKHYSIETVQQHFIEKGIIYNYLKTA